MIINLIKSKQTLHFKSMEQYLEHTVETFEVPESNFAKFFE